jgi:hypothetical protein
MVEFSWTLLANSRGRFCSQEFLLRGEFLWTFLVEFLWKFLVNFREHFFNSNDNSDTIIKQYPNLT